MTAQFVPTPKTTLSRLPRRGTYEREAANRILDEGLVCHIGFVWNAVPCVIPTGYVRVDDRLYVHGSAASRMLKTLDGTVDACVTVTLIDGLVLARSAFHHSVNYRSVVAYGKPSPVTGPEEKMAALRAFTEHMIPGRWNDIRWPNEIELKGTLVVRMALEEVSTKTRTGPPIDDEEDYALDTWGGVVPLTIEAHEPIADDRLKEGVTVPRYAAEYRRGRPTSRKCMETHD